MAGVVAVVSSPSSAQAESVRTATAAAARKILLVIVEVLSNGAAGRPDCWEPSCPSGPALRMEVV
ncbi:hypothetical protein GCM10009831_04790 [Dietzia cercidiphylli]|uniref:Secreted protein n=1 Tax=Dietzia cercidiphylli TaxID=498199 RepID=A0ABN2I744_9ACTN